MRAQHAAVRVRPPVAVTAAPPSAVVSISPQANSMQGAAAPAARTSAEDDAVLHEPRLRMLMELMERLTGQTIKVFNARELQLDVHAEVSATSTADATGIRADTQLTLAESETLQVSAQGIVRTADGQEIRFSLDLQMHRSMVLQMNSAAGQGETAKKDPLVINFQGNGVELANTQFEFDLNVDGQTESLAQLGRGSGFLALDRNGDGVVNNGSELFGARSGDGFADLAVLDADGNQWIDEQDPAYAQLRIWMQSGGARDTLQTLQQAGVGALHVGQVASPFTVRGEGLSTRALVRATGMYLDAQGRAGTLQQVDL